jgi:HK97 family phage portal protein
VVTVQDEITDELVDRLRSKWFARYGGSRRGSPAFLQAGMDVKPLGINLKDLEFPELRASSETHVCMAFKVPPILVNAKVGLDRSTFANYQEAVRSFWFGPLQALQRRFRDAFADRLVPGFTGVGRRSIMLQWDISNVPALREAESARWERATNALARGGITRNDFRRTVGLPPVPNGDTFLTPAGVVSEPAGLPGETDTVSASMSLLAAEFGVQLTDREMAALEGRVR